MTDNWWRTAVIYQVYPRSFADADGDGVGDLPGVTAHLDDLVDLGVDAVWLSPFYRSPQRDAGYDVADYMDVDPVFGTLEDADELIRCAHDRGLRVLVDVVPNHSSSDHPWFQEALLSSPGSPARARYLFRDGRGENGDLPPNNWESIFGGSMWTRVTEPDGTAGQWYLHIFDTSQPDFDWTNPEVRDMFEQVLRFWLDRGVDGFRVDVAHGLMKHPDLPDVADPAQAGLSTDTPDDATAIPYWAQDSVHDIYRDWRRLLDSYPGERVLVAEAWVEPMTRLADWVRPDEMHQAFNFSYLCTNWVANELRQTIDDSLAIFSSVEAPTTWVLSNHDVIRHATRLALTGDHPQGDGIGPDTPHLPEPVQALGRARAATALMLALPGSAYLYQGEELGLPEAIDLPGDARQDPTWFRTGGERYGRDGCRVPLPWTTDSKSYGFNDSGSSWLPQPDDWHRYARDQQISRPNSTLNLYKHLLSMRRENGLGAGDVQWMEELCSSSVLAFCNRGVLVIANMGTEPIPMPHGDIIASSVPVTGQSIPSDTTVWLTQ